MAPDWKSFRLGDLIKVEHGWPFKSALFSEHLSGKPIVVSVGNFDYSGGFRFHSTSNKEYRGLYPAQYNLAAGDILLVMTCQTAGGEILGLPARIPDDGRQYLHNQRLGKIVLKSPDVDPGFLYWVFMTRGFNQELVNSASGTKILHTAPRRIEAFELQLPSITEQRTIANLFDVIDAKIENNRKSSSTLEAIAMALFTSWFVNFKPVHANVEHLESNIDQAIADLFPTRFYQAGPGNAIPDGWQLKGLDEVASFLNGLALQKFPATDGKPTLPVIKIAQLRAGNVIGADEADAGIKPDYVIRNGDILFSWSGSLECEIWTGGPGALNQHLFKVRGTEMPDWFAYLSIRHHLSAFRDIAAAKATTMGHIQRHHLRDAKMAIPTGEVIAMADSVIGATLQSSWKRRLQSNTLIALRDVLLPKLMTGELRVREAERVLEMSA